MWYSSFCSEGPKNHLNSKILVSDFVPRGFEARRRWGFEAWNQGFRGTESGVSRHGIRGFEARNQGFRGAATLTEHLSASSFPAVPQGPIWRVGVSRGGGTNRISVLYHFLLTVPKHFFSLFCPSPSSSDTLPFICSTMFSIFLRGGWNGLGFRTSGGLVGDGHGDGGDDDTSSMSPSLLLNKWIIFQDKDELFTKSSSAEPSPQACSSTAPG